MKLCGASDPTVETQRVFWALCYMSEAIIPAQPMALAHTGPTVEKQLLCLRTRGLEV